MTMATQAERPGAITFKGGPMTLVGQELQVGDKLPEFHLQAAGTLATVGWNELSENGTKAVLMILVPSIDTSVCALETGKFNRHVASLPGDKIKTVSISADTPFAQARWAETGKRHQHPDAVRPQRPHVRRGDGNADQRTGDAGAGDLSGGQRRHHPLHPDRPRSGKRTGLRRRFGCCAGVGGSVRL